MHNKKYNFSLIELLVVIAIIGILASILLPILGKSRESAKRSLCLNNLRQIGYKLHIYTDDNDMYFPYASGPNNLVQWDDLISDYLTQTQREDSPLDPSTQAASADHIFLCPSDTTSPNGNNLLRSYAMNSSTSWATQNLSNFIGFSGLHGLAVQINNISKPSSLIANGERFQKNNLRGGHNYAVLGDLATSYDTVGSIGAHKDDLKYTYVFADGHTEYLSYLKANALQNQ
ncbi:type II secretion system protein [Lentisphaera profundi]|uniref:Type II secretion system protein n=1 Tax=Lentisphaera profundi TaxID=1658616 RepID=A0ABY7VWX9_9BACT|nr:type II secretion system protein [Lentisphaera profundi]WDE98416.1 type II secretion system protein [Lentisphaera profundi]